jgi:biopolymer transport protein ExbD
MIARPLDLASRLRPEPRNFDWLFYVNAGLIVLFFSVFGSRLVLAPGFGVDFRLPSIAGADANARRPTHVISVLGSGQIFTPEGLCSNIAQLEKWFAAHVNDVKDPVLLVRGDAEVRASVIAEISSAAKRAGFREAPLWAASDPTDHKPQTVR